MVHLFGFKKLQEKTADGWITVVQEERFRLLTSTGRHLLLTLSDKSNVDGRSLRNWHKQNAVVKVIYGGQPNFADGVAHRVETVSDVREPV